MSEIANKKRNKINKKRKIKLTDAGGGLEVVGSLHTASS